MTLNSCGLLVVSFNFKYQRIKHLLQIAGHKIANFEHMHTSLCFDAR